MNAYQDQRVRGRFSRTGGVAAIVAAFAIAGCDGLLDVDNPNNVLQQDIEEPAAASAVVNGALARTTIAAGQMVRWLTLASDEFGWSGSHNHAQEINQGSWRDPANSGVNDGFNTASVARWMSDEAVELMEAFEAEGILPHWQDLADAHLYAAISRLLIGDGFEDFVFSDRIETAPPIGEESMPQVYDEAVTHLQRMREVAQQQGDSERVRQAAAFQARALWSKELWAKFQPRGSQPADPLVNSAEAVAAAQEFLALSGGADWRYDFEFSAGSQSNSFASYALERREIAPSNVYVHHDASGRAVESVHFEDPIDGIVDPALNRIIMEFVEGGQFAPQPMVSAREMHLIVAEAALAQGDSDTFREHINAVRAFEGLSPYDGQIPELDMLKHTRKVNLYLMGRRLHDHYRFGTQSPFWLHNSSAVTRPGSLFPIGEEERQSNCFLLGTC